MIDNTDRWVENGPQEGRRRIDLAELWEYRELVGFFTVRDLKVRYKQAALGAAWAILQPLAGALLFTFVFGHLANLPSNGVPYTIFAFVGLSAWAYITASLNGAMGSLVMNASLVTKVYFPRVAAPVASVISPLADLAISFVLLAVLMAYYGIVPGLALLALPLILVVLVAIAVGAGLALAALNVKYRDVKAVLTLGLQLGLFASPVAYSTSVISPGWRWVYALNPMVGVLDALRWSLLGTDTLGGHVLVSLFTTGLLLWAGITCFARGERRFADVI